MDLLVIIDYSLVVIFFICITGFVLVTARSEQQQGVASVTVASLRESPAAYLLLAVLFILLIILTALTQRRGKQNHALG